MSEIRRQYCTVLRSVELLLQTIFPINAELYFIEFSILSEISKFSFPRVSEIISKLSLFP